MLRKLISLLIIFSFIVSDCSWCLREKPSESIDTSEDPKSQRRSLSIPIATDRRSGTYKRSSREVLSLREMSTLGLTMASSAETQRFLPGASPARSLYTEDEVESEEEESGVDFLESRVGERREESLYESIQNQPTSGEEQRLIPSGLPTELVRHPLRLWVPTDIETIPSLPPEILSLVLVMQELQNGDPASQRTARFLSETYDPMVKGKLLNRQFILGGMGGLSIAMGAYLAALWLYTDLVEGVSKLEGISTNLSTNYFYLFVVNNYVGPIMFADTGVRSAKTIAQLIEPSFSDFKRRKTFVQKVFFRGLDLIIYGASCPAGMLLAYALFQARFDPSNWVVEEPPLYINILGFLPLALPLFIDDVFYFGSRLSHLCQKKLSYLFRSHNDIGILRANKFRTTLQEEFKTLERLFASFSEDALPTAFRDIFSSPSVLSRSETSNLFKGVEHLRVLQVLHHYAETHKEESLPVSQVRSILHRLKKVPAWGLPLLATGGRSVIFYYILNETLEDIGLTNNPLRILTSLVVGGCIASFVQLKFEAQGIMHLLNKVFGKQEVSPHSNTSLRQRLLSLGVTLHSYACGLWLTAPYAVIGIFATHGWKRGPQLACLIPAGVTAVLGNAMAIEESSRDLGDFLKNLDLTDHPHLASQQRRSLVAIVKRYHDLLNDLDSEILLCLQPIVTQLSSRFPSQTSERLDGREFLSTSQFLTHIVQLDGSQNALDQRTRRFLSYAQEVLTENKHTWKQAFLSSAAGIILGIMGGGNYYSPFYVVQRIENLPIITNVFMVNYLVPFLTLEYFFRGSQVVSVVLSPSESEFESPSTYLKRAMQILRNTLACGATVLPCLMPVYCYGEFDIWAPKNNYYTKPTAILDFFLTTPFIFLNFLAFYGPHLSQYVETLSQWVTAPFPHSLGSKAEQTRKLVLREFKELKWWIAGLKKENDVHELYTHVLESSSQDIPLTTEEYDQYTAAKALKTLWVLRQYAQHNEDMMLDPPPEICRKTISHTLGVLVPLMAIGTALIYWYMFYSFFEFVGLKNDNVNMGLSVALGAAGSLAQGLVVREATQKLVYDLIGGKKIGQDTSHSLKRKAIKMGGKLHNFVMGGVYSIPFMTIGLLATQNWALWQRLCLLIPTALADTLKNAMMINESTGGAVQFIDNVASQVTSPSVDQKRNQLINLTRRYRQMFKRLHPDILLKLDDILTQIEPEPSAP